MSSETPPSSVFLPTWLRARLGDYFGIRRVFWGAAYYYLHDLWANLRQGRIGVLFGQSQHTLRDQAFARFYHETSQNFIAYESTTAVPGLVASAHGIVLDLGPGAGLQLARFDAAKIEHVYGVEPNTAFAGAFAERLRGTPLGGDGKYTLVPCGIEDSDVLGRFGIGEGSVDCVVSMQVMCSLPDVEGAVRQMHSLLKPGGELIFWEHCRSTDLVTRAVQWIWCLFWPSVIGGCRLDRVTKASLLQAADWEIVDIHSDCEPYMVMPRIWGRLVKAKAA
ncbi:unnamed protein product [Discula destructiva]